MPFEEFAADASKIRPRKRTKVQKRIMCFIENDREDLARREWEAFEEYEAERLTVNQEPMEPPDEPYCSPSGSDALPARRAAASTRRPYSVTRGRAKIPRL